MHSITDVLKEQFHNSQNNFQYLTLYLGMF